MIYDSAQPLSAIRLPPKGALDQDLDSSGARTHDIVHTPSILGAHVNNDPYCPHHQLMNEEGDMHSPVVILLGPEVPKKGGNGGGSPVSYFIFGVIM